MTEGPDSAEMPRAGLGRSMSEVLGARTNGRHSPFVASPGVLPLDALPLPLVITNRSGDALAVNRRWADMAGLPADRAAGPGWLDAFEADSSERLRADIRRVADASAETFGRYSWAAEADCPMAWRLAPYSQAPEMLVAVVMVDTPRQAAMRSVLGAVPGFLGDLENVLRSLEALVAGQPG